MVRLIPIILLVTLGLGTWVYQPQVSTSRPTVIPTPAYVGIMPREMSIPVLEVSATVEYVGLTPEGRMDVPKMDENVAWYTLGAKPGELGSAVLAGHLDTRMGGPAVFYKLDQLKPGDLIIIENEERRLEFAVEETVVYKDSEFPLELVFARNDRPRLNLITCEGVFDHATRNYSDRMVVFTVLQ